MARMIFSLLLLVVFAVLVYSLPTSQHHQHLDQDGHKMSEDDHGVTSPAASGSSLLDDSTSAAAAAAAALLGTVTAASPGAGLHNNNKKKKKTSTTTTTTTASPASAVAAAADIDAVSKSPTSSSASLYDDYDPADYPADTTGTLYDAGSRVMSWGAEAEMDDSDEDYQVYPDEPAVLRHGGEQETRDYFTDLTDYNDEQGPSFQKLILLAAARHRHRAHRVPPITIVV